MSPFGCLGLSYQGSQKGQQTKKVADVSNVEAVLEYDVWCLRGQRSPSTPMHPTPSF